MQMMLEFPADAPQILTEVSVSHGGVSLSRVGDTQVVSFPPDATIVLTLHTPDGAFTYTIDNSNRTLTTESDSPFLA